jgi:hypothetical protein
MLLYIILLSLFIFACYKENKEYNDSFILGKYLKGQSINRMLKNIKICMSYDFKTIKWRRIFISSIISTILIFMIVFYRIPEQSEFLLFLIIIFLIFSFMWSSYIDKTAKEVNKYCEDNILHIYKEINIKK